MKKLILITFQTFLLFIISACSDYESQIQKEIIADSEKYSELINVLEECNFSTALHGKLISVFNFPSSLNVALSRTKLKDKVNYIIIDKKKDCKKINVEFIIGNTHLEFVPCPDSGSPKIGSEEKIGNIYILGVDSIWTIWVDNDFI